MKSFLNTTESFRTRSKCQDYFVSFEFTGTQTIQCTEIVLVPQNLPRPIPHVEPRGASSDDNAHLVQLKGHVRVFPAMKSLEYIFTSPEGSGGSLLCSFRDFADSNTRLKHVPNTGLW